MNNALILSFQTSLAQEREKSKEMEAVLKTELQQITQANRLGEETNK
jgi:hypothetical protein